jgi:thioesterase domain-containing protein
MALFPHQNQVPLPPRMKLHRNTQNTPMPSLGPLGHTYIQHTGQRKGLILRNSRSFFFFFFFYILSRRMEDYTTQIASKVEESIPLFRCMGSVRSSVQFGPEEADAYGMFEFHAPLKENRNDKGTGFAGSLSSLSHLAGWAAVNLILWKEFGGPESDTALNTLVAIKTCAIDFKVPVTDDFVVRAYMGSRERVSEFVQHLRDGEKRSRLHVVVDVLVGDTACASSRSVYVAVKRNV